PDGTRADKGKNNDVPDSWKSIILQQLNRWESVSNSKLVIVDTPKPDGGQAWNVSGASQNDPRFGDIRIGTHTFDGPGKVLAHTYFPPPTNSGPPAGDMHFDQAEQWDLTTSSITQAPGSRGGGGAG